MRIIGWKDFGELLYVPGAIEFARQRRCHTCGFSDFAVVKYGRAGTNGLFVQIECQKCGNQPTVRGSVEQFKKYCK